LGLLKCKALEVYLASISASLTWGSAFTFNTFNDGSNWKYIHTAGKYDWRMVQLYLLSGSTGATAILQHENNLQAATS
jgi:hypothetical protein